MEEISNSKFDELALTAELKGAKSNIILLTQQITDHKNQRFHFEDRIDEFSTNIILRRYFVKLKRYFVENKS